MFTFSSKAVYGLTAVAELALHAGQPAIQIGEIARIHGIPQHYLEQILVQLKKAGLVESFRGAQGGYRLARRPGEILVRDVLGHLDGELSVVGDNHRGGMLQFYWLQLESSIRGLLDVTLEELLLRKQQAEGQLSYII